MKTFVRMIRDEEEFLTNIIVTIEKQKQVVPEGRLNVGNVKNKAQYYYVSPDGKRREYLKKSNPKHIDLAKQLAQRDYEEKLYKSAKELLSSVKRLNSKYHRLIEKDKEINNPAIEDIYRSLSNERKELVTPYEPTWESFVEKWQNEPYKGKEFSEECAYIVTDKGLRVRSKSEKMIAEYFDRSGILYKYECPLTLNNFGILHPDFTLVSSKFRKIMIWEHFGKMDDSEYANNVLKKIEAYQRNGYFIGGNLIATFESEKVILNTQTIETLAKKYLL
ncbi:MAG: hypothetical protein Q4B67_09995 [Eubacteriales bacterium]|nr:hypothetical protein [Eubacteriales bacterium]